MNVLSKKRLTSAQRSKVNRYVSTQYDKVKAAHEELIVKRLLFFLPARFVRGIARTVRLR